MSSKTGFLLTSMLVIAAATANAQDVWDSDGDLFDDNSDNCTLTYNPLQRDTDGDYNGNMCDPDFNNDNAINFIDLERLKSSFFSATDEDTDLNGDGLTNFADLGVFVDQLFGKPGPTATDPSLPPCKCYFSGDCNPPGPGPSMFCDWGSLYNEDNCVWRDIKPDGVYDAGCSIETGLDSGEWIPAICDGVCTEYARGSAVGREDTHLVAETLTLWGQAMMQPSAAGGGPLDAELARAATAMPFSAESVPMILGRHAADALAMAAGEPFHDYFCHWEGHPDDEAPPVVNLAGDTCRIRAGELTMQALAAEIRTPGTAAAIMKQIPNYCADWQKMFGTQCDSGSGALKCAVEFIEAQAYFLRTPRVLPSARPDPVSELLGIAR